MASNPAPGELELVRAFVNTWDADEDVENLPGPPSCATGSPSTTSWTRARA